MVHLAPTSMCQEMSEFAEQVAMANAKLAQVTALEEELQSTKQQLAAAAANATSSAPAGVDDASPEDVDIDRGVHTLRGKIGSPEPVETLAERLKGELDAVTARLAAKSFEVDELAEKYRATQAALAESTKDREHADALVAQLAAKSAEVDVLHAQQAAALAAQAESAGLRASSEVRIAELEASLVDRETALNAISARLAAKTTVCDELLVKHNAALEELAEVADARSQMEQRALAVEADAKALRETVSRLEADRGHADRDASARLADLQASFAECEAALATERSARDSAHASLYESNERATAAEAALGCLRDTLAAREAETKSTASALDAARAQFDDSAAELGKLT